MATEHEHLFLWPHSEPQGVIVTGTFDNWQSTVPLQRDGNNQFSGKVKLPFDSTVLYKYVVDGNWTTHDSQPKEADSSGNVNNILKTPSAPAASSSEPGAPLKHVADNTEASNTAPISEALTAAAAAGGAAVAAVAAAIGLEGEKSAEGTPINAASSAPVGATPEKPAEPAPTPAHLKDAKSEASLPTVPSGEDLQKAVEKDPEPHSAAGISNGPVLGGLAPVDERKSAAVDNTTAVEAAGPNAAQSGPADGQPPLRLAEMTAGAAAAGAAASTLPAALKTESPLPAVKGVEIYKSDGSIGKDANVAVAKPAKEPTKASKSVEAPPGLGKESKRKSALKTPSAPSAGGDVFKPVGSPAKEATPKKSKDAKVNGEKYGAIAQTKEAGKPTSVSRKSVPAVPVLDSSAPNTPAREEYKTAPSTPADTPAGLKAPGDRPNIPRTTSTSFFGKLKASLSPSKKK